VSREAAKLLAAAEAKAPDRPVLPANAAGSEPTKEQKDAYIAEAKAWSDKMKAQADEVTEVNFPANVSAAIKTRMSKFAGYYNDEKSRELALNLADKFGA
jgi:hypothetical protein